MNFKYISLKYLIATSLLVLTIVACDKDFSTIDSDIINDNAAHFDTRNEPFDILTYNRALGPVQSNNLPLDILGVFDDPIYGNSTYSFVSQVRLQNSSPVFGENVVLDSVVLTIPYFSTIVDVVEGVTNYKLDSVFGNSPVKLSIYENRYFLRDFDPNGGTINTPQLYYANGAVDTLTTIPQSLLEGTLIAEVEEFVPSDELIELVDQDDVSTFRAPALRLKLDNTYWQQKILDKQGDAVLSNANNFADYFRGLYFKAEEINGAGNLTLLNLAANTSNITLFYTRDNTVEDGERVQGSFVLNLAGNRVNFISPLEFNLPVPDEENGDSRLYLKGGQGSMAIVELFNGTDIDSDNLSLNQFETFKNEFVQTDENGNYVKSKRLINEANLVFYVDQANAGENQPERIYIYDLDNDIPLVDFVNEPANTLNSLDSRTEHLGRLEREGDDPNGDGVRYRIRITEHINSLLIRDSTNVKLGLSVSGNVNLEFNNVPADVLDDDEDDSVPVSSIITPRSTVLHGNTSEDENKRVFLEIFYTEPNSN